MRRRTGRIILLLAAAAGMLVLTGCSVLDKSNTSSGDASADSVQQSGAAAGEQTGAPVSDEVQGGQEDSAVSDAVPEEPVGEVIPDEWADAAEAENASEDRWSGRYVSDTESVTVTMTDEETISFAFAQSGISGSAKTDGNQAVFNGDDYHVVVFSLNDTVLNIAVSSEEDFDASASPLNGTYIRSAD